MNYERKLKNLVKLGCSVKVYVPSTVDVDNAIDNSEFVRGTLEKLSTMFWGATSYNALWCWLSTTAWLVQEKVTICESYCTTELLEQHIETVIELCKKLKTDMSQEAVSLEVNNELYFI